MSAAMFGRDSGSAGGEFFGPTNPESYSERTSSSLLGRWDSEAARTTLRQQVLDHLASDDGVLVIDEINFVKDSGAYVGAQRFVDNDGGQAEHRQTAIVLAYATASAQGYLDRELFLPRVWTEQESLRIACGLPSDVTFATRPQMARTMLERALRDGIPHRCIVGGKAFGCDGGMRLWLEEHLEPYVLAISGRETFRVRGTAVRAEALTSLWPAEVWRPVRCNGMLPRGEVWAGIRIPSTVGPDWERSLIARRKAWDSTETECFLGFARTGTPIEDLVAAVARWRRVSVGMRDARQSVGLDRFTGKSWEGWYRHMTVALMVHAMLGVARRDPMTRPA